jgi:hypothetical protein
MLPAPPPASLRRLSVATAIRSLLLVWALSFFPLFMAGAFGVPWPSWLQLPWSDMSDFVVDSQGRLFAYNAFYEQMMVYDASGRFLHSWPGPGNRPSSGGKCLAVAQDGRLFLLNYNTVFALSPEGRELFRVSADPSASRVWRLTESGDVEHVPNPRPGTRAPDRPVAGGEILLAEECEDVWPHKTFSRPDGGTVRRRLGPRLQLRAADGEPRSLGTPWYLLWAQLPYPFLPWILLVLWQRVEDRAGPR